MHRFLDATIKQALYDGENIYLETSIGDFKLSPYGDCCAKCFIQGASGTEALPGGTVTGVQRVDARVLEQDDDYEKDAWAWRITTTKGRCVIEMRLVHNGYYGGELEVEPIERLPTQAKPLEDF